MLPSNMKVNKKLLPIKGHYFFFNAGTAPLVPYLSTYARQLGFSSATVGLIYTVLPIFGLVAKPLFGVIADRFRIQKSLFILFQVVTIVSFSAIYFIPGGSNHVTVQLDCNDGASVLRSCYASEKNMDPDAVNSLADLDVGSMTSCDMKCDISTAKMWETICEHWHIPQYCYSSTDSIAYTAHVTDVTMRDNCSYIAANNVTLDGFVYTPSCHIGNGYVDINEPCTLKCDNAEMSSLIGDTRANMTCLNKTLNYRYCGTNATLLSNLNKESRISQCEAQCDLDESTPWRLMEICEGWGADVANTCLPKSKAGETIPDKLEFTGHVKLSSAEPIKECVFVTLANITLPDGSVHYSNCVNQPKYQIEQIFFHSSCEIQCNNAKLNEIFEAASYSRANADSTSEYTKQFWLFFVLMIVSWIGQAVVVTFADAICFNLLGDRLSLYGKQRLWGSVGWGIFSLLTGALIDVFSDGEYKNYAVAFVLMFIFMTGDVIVSCFLKIESTKMSVSIIADVGTLLSTIPNIVFFLWTIAVGLCTGLLWQFLFWHLEDIAKLNSNSYDYIKTLQGLVSAIQTFCGEIPFMFLSGYILKRLGHVNMMSLVLFAFGVRFVLYSFLTNAWWVLPIEMLQGITFGMFYPTMASYAKVVSPPGTETTVQGLVGAVFEGIGTSLGSFIGGRLYETYGGSNTFQWFGISSLFFCVVHIGIQYLIRDKSGHVGLTQGKENTDE